MRFFVERIPEEAIVVIKWQCKDGRVFIQEVRIPPKDTREARWKEEDAARGNS